MATLVDTSVLVDVLRGSRVAKALLTRRRRSGVLHSTEVVRTEVLAGMRSDEEAPTRRLLEAIQWHPVTEAISEEAGRLGRQWLPSHSGIDTADLIVAGTTVLLEGELLTTNVRHFPMFPDLQPPY